MVEEIPAPQRIAPFAAAIAADVVVNEAEIGSGRLVLLHDPAGNAAWQGTFRCVSFARADVDPEMVTDPLLAVTTGPDGVLAFQRSVHGLDEEIVELTYITCLYDMHAKMSIALRTEMDDVPERMVEHGDKTRNALEVLDRD